MSAGFPVPQNEVIDLTGNVLAIDDVLIDGQSIENFVGDLQDVEEAVVELNEELDDLSTNLSETYPFASRALAQAATVPADRQVIQVLQNNVVLTYCRDASGTALTTGDGGKWSPADSFFSPMHWGATGDGVTDDGAAINAALDAYRVRLAQTPSMLGSIDFDLLGRTYVTTVSLNGTKINTWSWRIHNGTIIGKCTGKPVLDLVGSRGGEVKNIIIYGDPINMPSVGIQAGRGTSSGHTHCDNCLWESVHTRGYFETVGAWIYGQETTTYIHCSFWNTNRLGACAFHVGTDDFEYNGVRPMLMQSDYIEVVTGETSFINDKYINCDYRYQPSGNTFNLVAISLTNPVVVQVASSHNFSIGEDALIEADDWNNDLGYGLRGTVTETTSNTVTLDIDGTEWPEYSGTGARLVKPQVGPSVIFGRGRDHNFDTCYIVAHGDHSLHVIFGSMREMTQINFGLHFEGSGNPSNIRFMTYGTTLRGISSGFIRLYQIRSRNSAISTDATSANRLTLLDVDLSIPSSRASITTATIFDDESNYDFIGGKITTFVAARLAPALFNTLSGKVINVDTKTADEHGQSVVGDTNNRPGDGGTQLTHWYRDASGVLAGAFRFSPASNTFSWAPSGNTFSYSMQATSFYPTTTEVSSLGLSNRYWLHAYVVNGRFNNLYVGGVAGVDGSFETADGKTVTVTKGVITAIV